ncbi:hypothetical protein VB773_04015 [Haloarculaceae archaeon H-GB2-1]|nr:hypothetical protein [Haloarculaceae archaeon H-GB1-1]MEA5388769.1 hypothetical protein [Haloarculaceae archaeon H-GB11]MEA5406825.1 hypothetical protein [Haloarculaceae archaeon H-GB2-1]
MSNYEVSVPTGDERGITVQCVEHGESTEFQPGYRRVRFHCDGCGVEVELDVRAADDWRDLGEMC